MLLGALGLDSSKDDIDSSNLWEKKLFSSFGTIESLAIIPGPPIRRWWVLVIVTVSIYIRLGGFFLGESVIQGTLLGRMRGLVLVMTVIAVGPIHDVLVSLAQALGLWVPLSLLLLTTSIFARRAFIDCNYELRVWLWFLALTVVVRVATASALGV